MGAKFWESIRTKGKKGIYRSHGGNFQEKGICYQRASGVNPGGAVNPGWRVKKQSKGNDERQRQTPSPCKKENVNSQSGQNQARREDCEGENPQRNTKGQRRQQCTPGGGMRGILC